MYRILALIMCMGIAFSFTGCGNGVKANSKELYIPVLADASWLVADSQFINGVNLAAEELNSEYANTGFTVKTVVIDDKAQYETGVEMAAKLAQDSKVTAVFNLQNFDVSKTTAGILSEKGKTVIFPYGAYDSLFLNDNPFLFCGVAAFSDLGKAMAAYTVKNGYRRIAVYHNGSQSQEELAAAFELALLNSGSKVVDYVPNISSQSEFDSIYSRWQALDVDCVVITQYGLDRAFEVLKMLRSIDKNMPVIGEPIFNRANALTDNKAISEGIAVPSTLVIEESEKLKVFKDHYRNKYGNNADTWAVQGYDMLRLIVDTAVKLGTNNPIKIAKALHSETGYQGIGRHIAFKQGGAMVVDVKRLPMLICKDGRFE